MTAYVPHNYPLDKLEPGLNETAFYDPTNFTFPGRHLHLRGRDRSGRPASCRVDRFTAVDDFGNIINPMIVEGQVHGGLVQGIGQALMENCVYDPKTGQLLTGSFMDYAMPRADDFPQFKVDTVCTPCTHNPLGAKGCGEAGAIGSPPAVINAVLDALRAAGRQGHRHAGIAASRLAGHAEGSPRATRSRRQHPAGLERRTTHVRIYTRAPRQRCRRSPARRRRRQAAGRRPDAAGLA